MGWEGIVHHRRLKRTRPPAFVGSRSRGFEHAGERASTPRNPTFDVEKHPSRRVGAEAEGTLTFPEEDRSGQVDRSVDGIRVQLATESGQGKSGERGHCSVQRGGGVRGGADSETARPHGVGGRTSHRHIVTSPERTSDVGHVTSRSHPKPPDT